jgi:hypothetical protein
VFAKGAYGASIIAEAGGNLGHKLTAVANDGSASPGTATCRFTDGRMWRAGYIGPGALRGTDAA